MGYGFHYCALFQQQLLNFSPVGRAWVLRTMTCLQHALVPEIPRLDDCGHPCTAACETLSKVAFASHPPCYVDSGVCDLRSVHDYLLILQVVGLKNVFTAQAVQTAFACVMQWLDLS